MLDIGGGLTINIFHHGSESQDVKTNKRLSFSIILSSIELFEFSCSKAATHSTLSSSSESTFLKALLEPSMLCMLRQLCQTNHSLKIEILVFQNTASSKDRFYFYPSALTLNIFRSAGSLRFHLGLILEEWKLLERAGIEPGSSSLVSKSSSLKNMAPQAIVVK